MATPPLPLPASFPDERAKTATLTRMLGMQGVIGMFGHVSIRVPGTDTVLLSPGAGSDKTRVAAGDIFVFDLDGTIREHPGLTIPIEWRLHTQIHRDRPDILSVVHLHAPHTTLLGIAARPLEPVFIHGGFVQRGIPTWDNPQLVTTDALAVELSTALGDKVAVQMRGHGTVVCGETAELAFFFATFLEENARYQMQAAALGGAVPLSPEDAAACDRSTTGNARLIDLMWNYHAAKAALT